MGLIKGATGLPKFTMNCGFWRSRRYVGAGLEVAGLMAVGVSYCYEHETDGWLPPRQDLAAALGVREDDLDKVIPWMLERGLWRETADGYEVVGYLDHNPSKAEVQEHRRKREYAAMKANHTRWHGDKPDPDCSLCRSDSERESESDSERESSAESQRTNGTNSTKYPPAFERVWDAYPRKTAKKTAFKAWQARRRAGVDAEELQRAAENYARDCERERREDRYVKQGSTFFGPDEHWRDYLELPPLRVVGESTDYTGRKVVP